MYQIPGTVKGSSDSKKCSYWEMDEHEHFYSRRISIMTIVAFKTGIFIRYVYATAMRLSSNSAL